MRLLVAALTLLTLSAACGQGAPEAVTRGMNLKSDVPRLVTTCGEIFLIGAHNPKILSDPSEMIVELKPGPIQIANRCSITIEEDGSISSTFQIYNPVCGLWCSEPEKIIQCKDKSYMLVNHPVAMTLVNYKILDSGELKESAEKCSI